MSEASSALGRRVVVTGLAGSGKSTFALALADASGACPSGLQPLYRLYNTALGGFYLNHEDVRRSAHPEQTLLDFCRSTYEAAATLGKWDRAALERSSLTRG